LRADRRGHNDPSEEATQAMRKILSNCRALLGESHALSDAPVDIVIEGRTIADIRPHGAGAAEGEVIDMSRRLIAPGLINGHHHSHEGYYKGRKDNLPLELWMNYVRPMRPIDLSPRDVYLRTMVGAIEAVKSGTTTLCDDLNASPRLRPDHIEAALQAYDDIGIRANVGITLFDKPFFRALPFVDEEFSPELLAELDAVPVSSPNTLLNFAEGLARARHPQTSRVAYMATPSAPQRCTEDFLCRVRRLADDFDLPLMIHVQETRLQVVTGQLWYGSTMVEYLHRLGFLKPKTQIIHGVWLNPAEIGLLAEAGASVQYNPSSNLKLGSGIAPFRALLDAGVNVSMGTDGCGSIDSVDMQNAICDGALIQKLRGDHTAWTGARETLHAATMGGAKALGRERELGAVEKGRIADLVAYRLDAIAFTPLNDAVNQLVYGATKADIDMVMVDGAVIQEKGRLTRVDEAALIAEIQEVHARISGDLAASERDVARLAAPYERIHRRCQHMPIPADTYPARLER
jgi:5-methylthioadenosine/S-adenosylhomocysteine deaminase